MSYQNAFEAIAKTLPLDNRVFKFIENMLTLDGLSQQMITELETNIGECDRGPTINRIEIRCATKNTKIYDDLESFLKKNTQEYVLTQIKLEKRPTYVTKSGLEISGTRKKAEFIVHDSNLDRIVKEYNRSKEITHDEMMEASYATRTYATILVYNQINLDFIEEKHKDLVIKKKGEPTRPNIAQMSHD